MKKGRHRRFEEARALKRSSDINLDELFESLNTAAPGPRKPEHAAWDDVGGDEHTEFDDDELDDDDDEDDD